MQLLSAQNGVSRLNKQLQIFRFLCTNMAALSLFQDGVSGVHKMTRYKDGGLHGKFFNCLKFLEKNTRGSRAQG
jgi:hypothetical protein